MTRETRVGLFVIGAAVVIAVASFFLGDVRLTRQYRIHVLFNDAGGLPIKGPVKSAGVRIGRVEEIELEDGRARVTASINRRYEIRRDAVARIASTGFIGSRFLDISKGTPSAPVLEDGEALEGRPSLSFDDWMQKFSVLFEKDEKYGDPIENIKATLANLRSATGALGDTLAQNREGLDTIIKTSRRFLANLEEITSASKEDIRVALEKFRKITERAEAILAKVQGGEGAVGTLVVDEETGRKVKETVASLRETAKDAQTLFGRIRRISVYWDYRQRFDLSDGRPKPDIGLRLVPRPGKFYFFSVNNLGEKQDRNVPGNDFEYRNTITAVMGKEFGPLTLYAGVIRASGGLGGSFRPFWKSPSWAKRFEMQAEAYDFGRDETVQGTRLQNPVFNAGGRVGLLRWLYAGVQVEDLAERGHVVGNLNVQLKDEDIAYLLGLVSLGKP